MEEASVAGESPDRSKQHESSEEPTSGSAGPVPEARTGASETRDPRLSVAREAAKPSASAGSGKSRGGVDTATRVLSVRDAQAEDAEADADADAESAGSSTASEDSDAAEDAPAGPAASDGRLRDAVAAWVATAEERAAANARREDAEDDAEDDAESDAGDTPGAGAAGGVRPDAGTATDTDEAPDGSGGTAADADAPRDTGALATTGQETDGENGAPGDGKTPAGGRDTAATDADEAQDGGAAADAGALVTAGQESGAPGDGKTPAGGRSTAATDDDESGGTVADADADAEGPQDGAKPSAGHGATADDEPAPEDDADRPVGGSAKASRDAESRTDERADSDTDGETPAGERTGAVAGGEPGGGSDAPRDGKKPSDGEGGAGSDGPRGSDADGDSGTGKEAGGDQPTAVFKALRPSAPEVDQPTTMLKLGDAAAPRKPDGSAESDAERTSKFVALRQSDDPATRKPPQKAPAAPPEAPRAPRTGTTTAVPHVGPERTTQQPLPPKPPLDLLAELTNTPPPPETPLRTTVRRVKIWTPLVLLLVVVLGVVQSMRALPAPELDLTAQESFTFEGGKPEIPWPSSGQAALDVQGIGTFGSSGEQKPVPIASVAKVMTAYVILRDHPLKSGAEGPMIEIDQAAEDQSDAGDESTVQVYAGDKISQREALDAILIASANNVARLLARWDAGSEKAFVEKMNAAAKDLGMTNTTYTDPSGLNNTTVSTAVDQVKLAKAAMESVAFREVAQKMSYDDYKGVNHSNWNQLVGHNGVVGIKTGTTTSALGNLVFAAKKEVGGETRTIVGAVVRQPATADKGILAAALDSSDKLIRAAQDVLESSTILKKGDVVGYVDDGLGGRTPVVATEDVKAVGWPGLTVKLTFEADEVPHTAAAGTKVGTLTVGDGGAAGAVKVPVALQKDLVEPAFTDKLTRLG
ncbi:D-alanyl-D-alanine carboxypeptidase [Streptomyces sp. AC602_WCS936]|uniref:D-alanyl-D-alanine carboxypeptidase n=1 Tax=Streptomyces sp. AC602_WCS936 TaxID=2823685 RepID=UPI0020B73C12|nr:D-alanyl-D-alanine carboxypeptidase [Streptomyces sp. AC602_WCS936]